MAKQNKPESPSSDAEQPQVGKSNLTAMKHEYIKNMEEFFDRAWWESFSLNIREELDRRFYSGKKLSPEEKAEAEAAKAKEMTDKEEEIKGVFDLLQELAEWGIKLGAQEPKSELYKTAIEFSDLLDTIQSNLSNWTDSQRVRCKRLLNRLYFLLDACDKNHGGKQRKPTVAEDTEANSSIPGEFRTSPMPKNELAKLWGGDVTPKKITKMIDQHSLNVMKMSRQSFIFDKRELPKQVTKKLSSLEQ